MKASPASRSKQALQDAGYFVAVAEHWNHHAGIRQDLGGFMDLLAWTCLGSNYTGFYRRIAAIQVTSSPNLAARRTKILALPQARLWLEAGGRIQLHGWAKQGPRGKRKVWTLRVEELTLADFPQPHPPPLRDFSLKDFPLC